MARDEKTAALLNNALHFLSRLFVTESNSVVILLAVFENQGYNVLLIVAFTHHRLERRFRRPEVQSFRET